MPRRPVHIEAQMTVRVPRGIQGYWEIIRDLSRGGAAWTTRAVWDGIDGPRPHIADLRDYVRRLDKAGIVASVGADVEGATLYRLERDPGPEAPRLRKDGTPAKAQGRGTEQMWRVLRMAGAGGVDARELAATAATEEHPVAMTTAHAYLCHLHKAGYLAVVSPHSHGGAGRLARYRLFPHMNTGPLAPMIQRTKHVWDPNRLEVMGVAEVEGADHD